MVVFHGPLAEWAKKNPLLRHPYRCEDEGTQIVFMERDYGVRFALTLLDNEHARPTPNTTHTDRMRWLQRQLREWSGLHAELLPDVLQR